MNLIDDHHFADQSEHPQSHMPRCHSRQQHLVDRAHHHRGQEPFLAARQPLRGADPAVTLIDSDAVQKQLPILLLASRLAVCQNNRGLTGLPCQPLGHPAEHLVRRSLCRQTNEDSMGFGPNRQDLRRCEGRFGLANPHRRLNDHQLGSLGSLRLLKRFCLNLAGLADVRPPSGEEFRWLSPSQVRIRPPDIPQLDHIVRPCRCRQGILRVVVRERRSVAIQGLGAGQPVRQDDDPSDAHLYWYRRVHLPPCRRLGTQMSGNRLEQLLPDPGPPRMLVSQRPFGDLPPQGTRKDAMVTSKYERRPVRLFPPRCSQQLPQRVGRHQRVRGPCPLGERQPGSTPKPSVPRGLGLKVRGLAEVVECRQPADKAPGLCLPARNQIAKLGLQRLRQELPPQPPGHIACVDKVGDQRMPRQGRD
ncbi:hypothetical protein amrb99_15920 [Actinomadura sp. RB99]|nr:hypothetical protein [Actinomadura sp. RB99]